MTIAMPFRRAVTLAAPFVRDPLWRNARAVPSLDLRFANNKSLIDAVTGASLVTFTRASSGTFTDSAGTLQTAATDVPRFDHNPTTGESLGLLVEEARTNSIRNNTMVGAVAGTPGTIPTGWGYVAASGGVTRQIVGTGSENGIAYIDIRFFGTTTNTNGCSWVLGAGVATTGQTWTGSTYWKLVGGTTDGLTVFDIGLIESTSGGAFVTGAFYSQTFPTSAPLITQRFAATRTLSGGGTVGLCSLVHRVGVPTATAIDFTIRIGLPQLEQGAFATSPIPTTTAAVTRSADVCSITGSAFSSWYRQDEGTVFADINSAPVNNIAQFAYSISNGTNAEWILSRRNTGGLLATGLVDGGVAAGDIASTAIAASARYKSAYGYALNNLGQSVNGGAIGTIALATMPTTSRFDIGQNFSAGQHTNGTIRRLTFWGQRLPNSTLQGITS